MAETETGRPERIDAHHHLWVRARTPQPWIDPVTMRAIDADFTTDDLTRALAGQHVTGTVVVQSVPTEAETADLLDVAIGTVKTQTARALARLRAAVPELGDLITKGAGR